MRSHLIPWLVALLALSACPRPSLGGWGPGGCAPALAPVMAPPAFAAPAADRYEWRAFADDSDQFALFKNGVQVGGWMWESGRRDDYPVGYYRAYDPSTGSWGRTYRLWPEGATAPPARERGGAKNTAPCCDCCDDCPCGDDCPCKLGKEPCCPGCKCCVQRFGDLPPCGVDRSKLSGRPRFCVGGKDVDPRAFFAGAVPADDSKKPYIAVVGDEAFQAQAKALFAPGGPLAPQADKFVIGFFEPGDWHVQGVGIRRSGVSIFGPRGEDGKAKELHYQADLAGLDKAVVKALREPNPQYDPSKTPDLRVDPAPAKPDKPAEPDKGGKCGPCNVSWPVWGVIFAALLVAILWKKK